MNQFASFGLMILYAVILLFLAKPLDNWRESRMRRKVNVVKQGELFESSKAAKERPLVASQR